jgi:hypothetical protein
MKRKREKKTYRERDKERKSVKAVHSNRKIERQKDR